MSRTTSEAVQAILASQYDNRTDLTPFLATANALTDWIVDSDTDSILSATLAERIECFLAAHFYAHADQLLQSKSTGGSSGSFQGQTGMILSSTQYGQSAMLLDITGALAQRSKEAEAGTRNVVKMYWLGLPPSEQLDVGDRD